MRTALLGPVLLLMLAGAVTGCSRYYWSKSGATAEQFAQDNQGCLQQAAGALPSGASSEAVEQYYRACLNSRGYVRDKHSTRRHLARIAGSRAARSSRPRRRPQPPADRGRASPAGPPLSRPI